MIHDVTSKVQIGSIDDETLSITKCVCGATFKPWQFVISIYKDSPYECPICSTKLYFENRIRVYQASK